MDNFNIQANNPFNNQPPQQVAKKFLSGPKIIFTILGLIILAELIYAVRTLTSSSSVPPLPGQKANIQKTVGKISLLASKTSYKVTETVPISVIVDTGLNEVSGVDLIVHFDPKVLEATSAGLVKGKILDEYPLVSVDVSKGLISISGVNSTQNSFKGAGQFAAINFKAKTPGQTSLTIDFQKGSTTDSNLVEAGTSKDILEQVDNLSLTVQ